MEPSAIPPASTSPTSSSPTSSSPAPSSPTSSAPAGPPPLPAVVTIRPWVDPVVDEHGHDPRSGYVEQFWLGVIGPTATWIMRRLASGFDEAPDGYTLDLEHTAVAMGLSMTRGVNSPFGRAVNRCVMFGLAQPLSDGFAVRRRLPQVAQRHLRRLPPDVQAAHDHWLRAVVRVDVRRLEELLIDAGIPPRAAVRATEAALHAA